jgi:Mg/Co/Ni transporter MgtE
MLLASSSSWFLHSAKSQLSFGFEIELELSLICAQEGDGLAPILLHYMNLVPALHHAFLMI